MIMIRMSPPPPPPPPFFHFVFMVVYGSKYQFISCVLQITMGMCNMGSGLYRVEDEQISSDLHHFLWSSNVFFNKKEMDFD